MNRFLLFAAGAILAGSASAQITEQPDGTLRTFHGFSMASSVSTWGFVSTDVHDGLARQVVFADNGDVFFKDPLSKLPKGTWIKGSLKDDVITVSTPQLLESTEKDGETTNWYVRRMIGEVTTTEDGDEKIVWSIDPDNTDITFTFRNDSIIQDEHLVKLGLTADDEDMFYGDYDIIYSAVDETAVTLPENIEPETWSFKYRETYAHQIKVAFDNDKMYIKGFWEAFPDATIYANVTDDRVYIPSQQYLGFMSSGDFSYYVYLMSATINNEGYMSAYLTSAAPLEFAYDRDAKTITPLFDESVLPVIRYGKTPDVSDKSVKDSFAKMNMAFIDHIGNLLTPSIDTDNPWCIELIPEYGWGYVEFSIPAVDDLGNALNTDNFAYSVWLDDEIYVFDNENTTYDNYAGLEEPATLIPYNFDNDAGISTRGSVSNKYVQFFSLGFNELGIQTFYYDEISDNTLSSPIIYINPLTLETRVDGTVGIGAVAADNDAVETNYYDLSGKKVDASCKGLLLKVIRKADGSVTTVKHINR